VDGSVDCGRGDNLVAKDNARSITRLLVTLSEARTYPQATNTNNDADPAANETTTPRVWPTHLELGICSRQHSPLGTPPPASLDFTSRGFA
jgi:hypothetical protein